MKGGVGRRPYRCDDFTRLLLCRPNEQQPTSGGLPCAPQYRWFGVNNGLLMMRLDRIRANLSEYWGQIMRVIREKAYRAPRFSMYHDKIPPNVMKQCVLAGCAALLALASHLIRLFSCAVLTA